MSSARSSPDIVHLNVGGTIYTTSRATLVRGGESLLGHMFSGLHHTAQDEHGRFFIDRDGQIFRYILNFLRTSKLVLPNNFDEWDQLKEEVDFYQIQPLAKAVDELLEFQKHKQEEEEDTIKLDVVYYLDVIEHNQLKTSGKYVHIVGDIEVLKTLPLQLDEFNQLSELQEQALLTDYHPQKSDNGYTWHLGKNHAEIQYLNYLTRAELNTVLSKHGCNLINSAVSYTNATDTSNNDTLVIADKWEIKEKNLNLLRESCWARRALPPGRTIGFIDWTPPN